MMWLLFVVLVYIVSSLFTERYTKERNELRKKLQRQQEKYKLDMMFKDEEIAILKKALKGR